MQRRFSSLPEEVRVFWPPDTPRLTLRELAWQYLERVTASQDFCPQTRFLCNAGAAGQFGLSDGNDYGLDSHEMARLILKGFHFVGIVEEMKKSLEVLADRLLQHGVRVYFDLNLKLNAGAESSRPAWLTREIESAGACWKPAAQTSSCTGNIAKKSSRRTATYVNAVG